MRVLKQGEYFGSQRWELRQKGIVLSEYDYLEPGTPWHFHENPYFMYVIKGEMLDLNKACKTELVAGDLMFLNWQEPHCTEKHSNSGRGFHLQLDRKWLDFNDQNAQLYEGSKIMDDPSVHLVLSKIYFEFRKSDEFSVLSIEVLVMDLCNILRKNSSPKMKEVPAWIIKLKDILHSCPNHLSLNELSEQLGVHPVHISRSIPLFLDSTLGEYMRKLRIKKALPLVLNKGNSLSQIAYECGFSDQSHFNRVFRGYYNHSPKEYRSILT
ncbi:MAG: helix-turn-helix domain-containing protein [Flavobacteriales bacterium]